MELTLEEALEIASQKLGEQMILIAALQKENTRLRQAMVPPADSVATPPSPASVAQPESVDPVTTPSTAP
jgi:hypothetical protein